MYKSIAHIVITLISVILLTFVQVFAQEPFLENKIESLVPGPEIRAESAILTETSRGQILFQKNPNKRLHISTANKLMTAIIVLEKCKLDEKVTISKEASSSQGSVIYLGAGEKYTVEELLYALMLKSANDATTALAEYVAGDTEKFVDLMNSKSSELKLKNTLFKNPTGLYDENQYTTAYDLSIIIKYALSNSTFNNIFSTKAKVWFGKTNTSILISQNNLFWSYNGIDGGKIGYNEKDKQAAVVTATRDNRRLISIVLNSPEESVFEDSVKLLDHGFENFRKGILASKGQSLKRHQIGNNEVNLICPDNIYYTFPIGMNYIKSVNIEVMENIKLPVTKKQILGTATYVLMDDTVISVELHSDTDIYPPEDFWASALNKLTSNKDILVLIIILLMIELIIMICKIFIFIKRKFAKEGR